MGVCHAQWGLPCSGIPEAESVIWCGLWGSPQILHAMAIAPWTDLSKLHFVFLSPPASSLS